MAWWEETKEAFLSQGELIPGCVVPVYGDKFPENLEIAPADVDLIVLTQSCDLEHKPPVHILVSRYFTWEVFKAHRKNFDNATELEALRRGEHKALVLLPTTEVPEGGKPLHPGFVVDFKSTYTLPAAYLVGKSVSRTPRFRLRPPYVEYFSQRFANWVGRVALPVDFDFGM